MNANFKLANDSYLTNVSTTSGNLENLLEKPSYFWKKNKIVLVLGGCLLLVLVFVVSKKS